MNLKTLAPQPAYVKLVNRTGELLQKAGFSRPDLDAGKLIKQAKRKTGLADFGDPSFMAGLEVLTTGLREQAQLSQIGRLAAHFNVMDHLCARLQIVEMRSRRPEISSEQIKQPLFITGLPRTGTTILYELIAQDPGMRSPASWEVARPMPPPQQANYDRDPRIRSVDRMLTLAEKLSPGFRAIHAIGAKLPQECVYLLAPHFISELFGYMYKLPAYRAWALDQDMTASYRWHANFLQHLQVDCSRDRWVLKSPAHLAYLKFLLAQYPDAAIVWTHRRPLDAMASFSSLACTLRGGYSDTIDPVEVGAHEFKHFSNIVGRGLQQRAALPQTQFFDASFSAICDDPIAVIRDIYAYFDIHLSDVATSRMHRYLQQRPRNLFGEHHYSHQDFGLQAAQEGDLYAQYLAQYRDFLS